jgi:hypothetical protein
MATREMGDPWWWYLAVAGVVAAAMAIARCDVSGSREKADRNKQSPTPEAPL